MKWNEMKKKTNLLELLPHVSVLGTNKEVVRVIFSNNLHNATLCTLHLFMITPAIDNYIKPGEKKIKISEIYKSTKFNNKNPQR